VKERGVLVTERMKKRNLWSFLDLLSMSAAASSRLSTMKMIERKKQDKNSDTELVER
jgi:hypothetical protein